jgi:HSP90 family molecular chaperone
MSQKAWLRQANESAKAYEAAREYFELGANRSIEAVSQKLSKSIPTLKDWSRKYDWVERAKAYDAYQLELQEKAREKAAQVEAEKWEKRRAEQREVEWNISRGLLHRASQILSQPLNTARYSHADAARIADVAVKLARLAAEMATAKEQHEVTGKDGKPIEIVNAASDFDSRIAALFERITKEEVSSEPVDSGQGDA